MLDWRLASAHVILAVALMLWGSREVLSVDVATEALDAGIRDVQSPPTVREEKSAADLAAKLMLLDELVSLENDVIETKKKRSFSGFGSPLDRLSAGSMDHKGKQSLSSQGHHLHAPNQGQKAQELFCDAERLPSQTEGRARKSRKWIWRADRRCPAQIHTFYRFRKVVDHPKRRFGIPIDRIGGNRLSNSRG